MMEHHGLASLWRWWQDAIAFATGHSTRRLRLRSRGFFPVAAQVELLETRDLLSTTYFGHGGATPFASSAPSGLTPAQVLHAYGIDHVSFNGGAIKGDGTGQTIAIIDLWDAPNIAADLATFDTTFGIAAPPRFTKVAADGSTNYPPTDPAGKGSSWAVETSLDVEWAHAIAPRASILLVEASNIFSLASAAQYAATHGATVVSMSYTDATSTNYSTPGVVYVAATGDDGQNSVTYPAESPNVVAVGGTVLSIDGLNNWAGETGWSGSSGGISGIAQPTYQSGVVSALSTTYRTTPDVAFDAGSGVAICDSWDFGAGTPWAAVGGTSVGAPCWAGLVAIADQGRVLAGKSVFSSASLLTNLYALPSSDFHDITSGSNAIYSAGVGYDLVTGLGTPKANQLIADLAGGGSIKLTAPSLTASVASTTTNAPATLLQKITQGYGLSNTARQLQYSSNITAGSLLVAFVGTYSGTTATVAVADNVNGAWTQVPGYSRNGANAGSWWYVRNAAGGVRPNITVTPSVSVYMTVSLHEYSVSSPGGVTLDAAATNSGIGTTISTGAVSVSGPGELVLAGFAQGNAALMSVTAGGPFTLENNQSIGTIYEGSATADDTNASSAEGAVFTVNTAVSFAAMSISFKIQVASASTSTNTTATLLQKITQGYGLSSTARQLQYSGNIAAGSLLVAFVGTHSATTATVAVADNVNGAWTQVPGYSRNGANAGSWWYVRNSAGGVRPIITVTPSGSAYMTVSLHEYSVSSPGGVTLDAAATNSGIGTTISTGAVSVSGPGELVLAGFTQGNAALTSVTVGGPFTLENNQPIGTIYEGSATADDTNASRAEGAVFTVNTAVSFAGMTISFKIPAASASPTAVNLAWGLVPQALGYRVYQVNGAQSTLLATLGTGATSYLVAALTPGSTVSFYVEAFSGSATADSAIASVTLP